MGSSSGIFFFEAIGSALIHSPRNCIPVVKPAAAHGAVTPRTHYTGSYAK